ncbi:MAG: hypothetical protein CMF27_07150 [Kiritimatiellaceae bacterium]|nr:hypothetical protein [Kiritimatiellaceae bacterium]
MDPIPSILAGLALGWVAIPHCFGMCGPLHVSVCALHRSQSLKALSLFNLGRITGYSLAGVFFGAFGEFINLGPSNFCCQLDLFPVRGALLALLFPGVTMLWIGIYSLRRGGIKVASSGWLARWLSGGLRRLAVGGVCTTLIPCGMLYAAFALAVGTGSWLSGLCFMFAFAITQTFFMQLGISVGRLMGRKWSERMEAIFPWLCLAIGLLYLFLFIQRLTPK